MLKLLALLLVQPVPEGAVLEAHERRGAVIARLDGLPGESWQACAAACGLDRRCEAWTWRAGFSGRSARCDILSAARTPVPAPGAVTGLSPALAARIEAAGERAPDPDEVRALEAVEGEGDRPRSGDPISPH
ncbi:hypothetical protein E5163_00600 [Marinicauda algicola]|uniref:Apple domain-containing protein n=1 Tax=Marinicauda algicola TaxID=2029849 RepID=A0A4S2H2C7_9PROT|nr:PAN domain-containing protein [Marinicauda algicola]TGY89676.1 hypothetical protein E5163_00600 [Marinicauda algicola]